MTTSDIDLKLALRKFPKFIGVFMNNALPERFAPGEALIANLEPSSTNESRGGSHWVCVVWKENMLPIYIDPFGMPPTQAMDFFLKGMAGRYLFSNIQYQKLKSQECGMFCCRFVMSFLEGRDMNQVFQHRLSLYPSVQNEKNVRSDFFNSSKTK